MFRFHLLFIVIPAVELYLLIIFGSRFGFLATLALVLITGIVGATVARAQGMQALQRIQAAVLEGRPPAREIVDGVLVLVGGLLLLTPGILTDVAGLLLLLPPVRALVRGWAWRWAKARFEASARAGAIHVEMHSSGFSPEPIPPHILEMMRRQRPPSAVVIDAEAEPPSALPPNKGA
jgi:UPF0716 protein FxsA